MDAVPIVPPLFWGTKNTTLHELQTGDRSRATDIALWAALRVLLADATLAAKSDGKDRASGRTGRERKQ
jgi:hypothetical protein